MNDHRVAVSSLGNVSSKKIDAQVFQLLQDALKTKFSSNERYKLTWLTEACLKRLYGQNFHADGRSNPLFDLCNRIIEKEKSSDPIYEKTHPYNFHLRRVVLSLHVKYEPKKSRQLFSDFQSSDTEEKLSEQLKMLSEPATVEPWMLDFLKGQLSNKAKMSGFEVYGPQEHPVRFCDRAAQIIAGNYLENPV